MKAPPVTEELIQYLRRQFPDRIPKRPISEQELAVRVGEQRVIRKLEDIYETHLHG